MEPEPHALVVAAPDEATAFVRARVGLGRFAAELAYSPHSSLDVIDGEVHLDVRRVVIAV